MGDDETMDGTITVVIPTRNRAKLLERLLGQVLSLTDSSVQVIVIDEASSDDTPQLLERLGEDQRLHVIRHDPPHGLPAARNVGLRAASGSYVAWIDDDDLTAPDRLERQLELLQMSGSRWSCAGSVDIDDDLSIIGHRRCPRVDGFLHDIVRFNHLPAAAQGLLVERRLALEVGGFDESLQSAEDWEFCIRLAEAGEPVFLDEPLVGYRTGYASMSTDTAKMETAIREVLDKHSDLRTRLGVEPDWAAIHQSLLTADFMTSRWAAFARCCKLVRAQPSFHNFAHALAILMAPQWWADRSARERSEQVPAHWRTTAERWLGDVQR